MSFVGSQQRTLLHLLGQLRPHWRVDRNLPARVQTLLSSNRSFGSRDRRLYRELIYATLRYLPWIDPALDTNPDQAARIIAWLAADARATEHFRAALVADWPPCPHSVAAKAELLNAQTVEPASTPGRKMTPDELLPQWVREECPRAFEPEQLDALHTRAPLWLRVKADALPQVTAEFDHLGWRWRAAAALPTALQLMDEADVTKTRSFESGFIEVQDLASQLLLESASLTPGSRWLDACAGAGGKTLQLATLLGTSGHVDAFDIRRAALAELDLRARRARLKTISILSTPPTQSYDGVLVDAPCTGSGTWRRAPHLKWTTTPARINEAATLQRKLLTQFSERVRPGGRLLYATCSLIRSENEAIVAGFLEQHSEFRIEPAMRTFGAASGAFGLKILPALHDTDGFFVASFRRIS
ncbi:MAG: RsmB/NOP family class I SAM-dependent RNA methyltransferase [Opitutus sp.]